MPIAVHARRFAFLISIFYTFFIIVRNNWMYRGKVKEAHDSLYADCSWDQFNDSSPYRHAMFDLNLFGLKKMQRNSKFKTNVASTINAS